MVQITSRGFVTCYVFERFGKLDNAQQHKVTFWIFTSFTHLFFFFNLIFAMYSGFLDPIGVKVGETFAKRSIFLPLSYNPIRRVQFLLKGNSPRLFYLTHVSPFRLTPQILQVHSFPKFARLQNAMIFALKTLWLQTTNLSTNGAKCSISTLRIENSGN